MKRFLLLVTTVCAGWLSVGVNGVNALSTTSKPTSPVLSKVAVSVGSSTGRVSVAVTFTRARTNAKSPLLVTQVKVGSSICTALRKSTTCVVKNLVTGRRYRIVSRARNRNGYGGWSPVVSLVVTPGLIWNLNPGSSTRPTLPPISSTTTILEAGSTALKFNFQDASAVAVLDGSVTTSGVNRLADGSNLRGMKEDGSFFELVSGGFISVKKLMVAPLDNIYILLNTPITIDGSQCILLHVDRSSGRPTCVENDVSFLKPIFHYQERVLDLIQFDSTGAIYYAGVPDRFRVGTAGYFKGWNCSEEHVEYVQNLIVRRWKRGVVTDFGYGARPGKSLIQPEMVVLPADVFRDPVTGVAAAGAFPVTNQCVHRFAVSPSGDVLIDQSLGTTQLPWNSQGRTTLGNRTILYKSDGTVLDVTPSPSWCNDRQVDFRCNSLSLLYVKGDGAALTSCHSRRANGTFVVGLCGLDLSTGETTLTNGQPRLGDWESQCENWVIPRQRNYLCSNISGGTIWRGAWKTPAGNLFAVVGGANMCVAYENGECWHFSASFSEAERLEAHLTGMLVQVDPSFSMTKLGAQSSGNVLMNIEVFVPVLDSIIAAGPESLSADGRIGSRFATILYNTSTKLSRDLIPSSEGLRVKSLSFSTGSNRVFFSAVQMTSGVKVSGTVDVQTGVLSYAIQTGKSIIDLVGMS